MNWYERESRRRSVVVGIGLLVGLTPLLAFTLFVTHDDALIVPILILMAVSALITAIDARALRRQ